MLLSDRDIRQEMLHGLRIEPLEDKQYQPASVDIRLGEQLRRPGGEPFRISTAGFVLYPGDFILGDTVEYLQIPWNLAAQFAGKSSLGRQGLQTHCTAGFVDPGFQGTLTVELSNLSNDGYVLYRRQPIGQLCVFRLSSPVERPYGHPGLGSQL